MSAAVPTLDQVLSAVMSELLALSPALPGPIYHYEDRLPNDWESQRPLITPAEGSMDIWWLDAIRRSRQGDATDEVYELYEVTLRYVCVRANEEEEWSRQARFNLERASTEISGNDAIFAISAQPLFTPKTTDHTGGFTTREGTKVWEGRCTFTVEARRWS